MKKLNPEFYLQEDVVKIAKELLGKVLITNFDGEKTSGIITETEAYAGITDKASHAYNHRYTERTKVMYERGGIAYIYLCYGIHHLFNIVTNKEGIPDAVLIRSIKPYEGMEYIRKRRNMDKIDRQISNGPGKVSQALGLYTKYSGESLFANKIWLEDHHFVIHDKDIIASTRIGVAYAMEDALLPYRFSVQI